MLFNEETPEVYSRVLTFELSPGKNEILVNKTIDFTSILNGFNTVRFVLRKLYTI